MRTQFSNIKKSSRDLDKTAFGGEMLKGKRKARRPLSVNHPIHLILKSNRAFGNKSLLHPKNRKLLLKYSRRFVRRFDIKLYRFANVGNHIHIHIKAPNRKAYVGFVSALTGTISKMIFKANGMWESRPFTRVVEWGRGHRVLKRYVEKNIEEGLLIALFQMRKNLQWRQAGIESILWWEI